MGFADLRWSILSGYWPLFLQGLQMTLGLTAVSLFGGLALGILLGLLSSTTDSGDFRLRIVAGYEGGIPYGIYPRLLMSGWPPRRCASSRR